MSPGALARKVSEMREAVLSGLPFSLAFGDL
jgi:hypothetical protein